MVTTWEEIPYSTKMLKIGEYTVDVFERTICIINAEVKLSRRQKQDAALIAAAPDLLAACKAFVEAYEKSLQLEKTDVALEAAKRAIEKCKH